MGNVDYLIIEIISGERRLFVDLRELHFYVAISGISLLIATFVQFIDIFLVLCNILLLLMGITFLIIRLHNLICINIEIKWH